MAEEREFEVCSEEWRDLPGGFVTAIHADLRVAVDLADDGRGRVRLFDRNSGPATVRYSVAA